MEDKKYLELKLDGKIVKYEILYTLKFENNDKTYLVYTDNTYDKDNDLNVYAGEYDKNADIVLKDIEDDEIFDTILDIVDSVEETRNQNA